MSDFKITSTDIAGFQKTKEFLICVDSDGCAVDSMNVKHFKCFGPLMIKEWGLYAREDEILSIWNEINLYKRTRGVNRFKGLALTLREVNEKFHPIAEIGHLLLWCERGGKLSNDALRQEIANNPDVEIFKKALFWSTEVNRVAEQLGEKEMPAFDGVREGLEKAHEFADIAVVSGADPDSLVREWGRLGLTEHVDLILAQNAGSKNHCIGELLKKGYLPQRVLMCGDAPGDLEAAEDNGVFFFPVLVRKEKESWEEFHSACKKLREGEYLLYGARKKTEFLNNLEK